MEKQLMDYFFHFLLSSFRKKYGMKSCVLGRFITQKENVREGSSPLKFILRKWIVRIKIYNLPFKKFIGQIFIENLLICHELF